MPALGWAYAFDDAVGFKSGEVLFYGLGGNASLPGKGSCA